MWVARNRNGSLLLFYEGSKPTKPHPAETWCWKFDTSGVWRNFDGRDIELNPSLFPNLTWEDEPIEVELTLKIK